MVVNNIQSSISGEIYLTFHSFNLWLSSTVLPGNHTLAKSSFIQRLPTPIAHILPSSAHNKTISAEKSIETEHNKGLLN